MVFSILLSAAQGKTSPGLGLGPAQPTQTRHARTAMIPKNPTTCLNRFMVQSSLAGCWVKTKSLLSMPGWGMFAALLIKR
jgi:hypothetical protein